MKDKQLEQQLQQSLDVTLSGLRTTSRQREQFLEIAMGGHKVKRKLTYGFILTDGYAQNQIFLISFLSLVT